MALQMITEQPVHPVIEEKVTGSTTDKKAISNYGIVIAILMFFAFRYDGSLLCQKF